MTKNSTQLRSFRNSPHSFIPEALGGAIAAHPDAEWHTDGFIGRRSAICTYSGESAVAIVSGGGSGHEPLHGGFLGAGMLSAVCPGHLFTSPNAVQIAQATRFADQGKGVLHIVKNYTGDVMNFTVARQSVKNVDTAAVIVNDDVATDLGEDNDGPGRRGTGATIIVEKIAGAAAARGDDLATVTRLAQWVADNSRSMAVSLAAGHLPTSGRNTFDLESDMMELGVGIHGERGVERVPLQEASAILDSLLSRIIESLGLSDGDNVILLVNGLGGTTLLEIDLMFGGALEWLAKRNITIKRSLVGSFVTSVNMNGISLTLTRTNEEITQLLDAPTQAPAWPHVIGREATYAPAHTTFTDTLPTEGEENPWLSHFVERVQVSVNDLTELDRQAGDGDFGQNMEAAFAGIPLPLKGSDHDNLAGLAHRLFILAGGTSGAVLGTLFRELADATADSFDTSSFALGLRNAYNAIYELGGAVPGDNTMVDALYPAMEAVSQLPSDTSFSDALNNALNAATQGALSTRSLIARKGRASYFGANSQGVPDPGAILVTWLFGDSGSVANFR